MTTVDDETHVDTETNIEEQLNIEPIQKETRWKRLALRVVCILSAVAQIGSATWIAYETTRTNFEREMNKTEVSNIIGFLVAVCGLTTLNTAMNTLGIISTLTIFADKFKRNMSLAFVIWVFLMFIFGFIPVVIMGSFGGAQEQGDKIKGVVLLVVPRLFEMISIVFGILRYVELRQRVQRVPDNEEPFAQIQEE